jgi:non-ribosomal peptide synthetase component F
VAALSQHAATHLVCVPSVLRLLRPCLAAAWSQLRLALLVSSGEALTWRLAAQLRAALPASAALLNLYGAWAPAIASGSASLQAAA